MFYSAKAPSSSQREFYYDRWILLSAVLLLSIGLLMVASASMVISDRQFGYPFHYLMRQAVYLFLGLLGMILATRVSMETWQRISVPFLFLTLFLLVVVLIPGICL